ncbi:MAG: GTPase Era [Alphaproteobacteria bacterium]|nr:GTPase Era [Alphaproteobacteria bacterium]
MNQKANFIAFIGAPNVGKSTLLNKLIGQKLSIVTPKAQTTRTSLKGIKVFGDTQLIFIDTPGLFDAKTYTDKVMVDCAWQMIAGTDHVCLLVDAKNPITSFNKDIIAKLHKENIPITLIINKVDTVEKATLLESTKKLNDLHQFENTFMISALKGKGTDDLISYFTDTALPQPWPFAEDDITTAPINFMVSEIVREKIFLYTNKEIPYSTHVEVEHWEKKNETDFISILIRVRDKNHKKIILGSGGSLIKKIGTKSRIEIQELLENKVFLKTHIKITPIDKIKPQELY